MTHPLRTAAAVYLGFLAVVLLGAGVSYAVEFVVRRRRGLPPAGVGAAAGRGFAGALLLPAVTGWAVAATHTVSLPGGPVGALNGWSFPAWVNQAWVNVAVVFAFAYPPAAAAAYASLTDLRRSVPRGEVVAGAAAGAFVWLAGCWAGVAGVVFFTTR